MQDSNKFEIRVRELRRRGMSLSRAQLVAAEEVKEDNKKQELSHASKSDTK